MIGSLPHWEVPADPVLTYLRKNVLGAVETIKSQPEDLISYRQAINTVEQYLNAVMPVDVRMGLTYLKVRNPHASDELKDYLDRPDNIYDAFIDAHRERLLGDASVDVYMLSLVVLDQLPASIAIARAVRREKPKARIYIGGPLVSRLSTQLRAIPWIADTI